MPSTDVRGSTRATDRATGSSRAAASDAGEFYDTYFPLVYAYFRRRTRDEQTAEDLTADTFGKVVAAMSRFEPGEDPDRAARVWVYKIAGNVFKNSLRSEGRRSERDERWLRESSAVTDGRDAHDGRLALTAAMDHLGSFDREIVSLRYWDELTAAEIGEVVGLKQREVYTALERCLRELRRVMDGSTIEVTHD